MNWKYYYEKFGPYIFSFMVVFVLYKKDINFIENKNMDNALDGINTLGTLIIGFLGAILPVILGMKNESKMVKYVFEKDSKKLFLKYIKITLAMGIITVLATILMYFRDDFNIKIKRIYFYVWAFFVLLFLLLTYRCLVNMLELIFSNDKDLLPPYRKETEEQNEKKRKLEEYFGN